MSPKPKKSVLIDLSETPAAAQTKGQPPFALILVIVSCIVVAALALWLLRSQKSSKPATLPILTKQAAQLADLPIATEDQELTDKAVAALAEPEQKPALAESTETKASTSPSASPAEQAATEPTFRIGAQLHEIQQISQSLPPELSDQFDTNITQVLAFQLESARQKQAAPESIHTLENEYARSLAEQSNEVLQRYLQSLTNVIQSIQIENYAALEWKQLSQAVKNATEQDRLKNAYEALQASKHAYDVSQNFIQVARANIKALAQHADQSQQTETAAKLYQKLLGLVGNDSEASAYLHHHAYVAGTQTHTAAFGIKMQIIPAGEYLLGSPELEFQRDPDEVLHRVKISKAYYISETEITQAQWLAVMGQLPAEFPSKSKNTGDSLPIHSVRWSEAVAFCQKLSEQSENMQYRLPTEAEWEIACRAGMKTPYNNGQDQISLDEANIFDPNFSQNHDHPIKVASYAPNQWGLYDMHGNVWEWTSDWMADYNTLNTVDPSNSHAESSSDENLRTKVLRGGSYYDEASLSRSGNRWSYAPSIATDYIGFRIACTATF